MICFSEMPEDFKYKDTFLLSPPVPELSDSFRLRHPSMDPIHRAKIFSPFAALTGFESAIASKKVLYESRRELSDDEKAELDRRIRILYRLSRNCRLARENAFPVEITYFTPCRDEDSTSYGTGGRYVTVSGICREIGRRTVTVDKTAVPLGDIVQIENPKEVDGRSVFDFPESGFPEFDDPDPGFPDEQCI